MNNAGLLAGDRILLTLWVGSLWAIGYIAAPTLFATLEDRALAGTLAGAMFVRARYLLGWVLETDPAEAKSFRVPIEELFVD